MAWIPWGMIRSDCKHPVMEQENKMLPDGRAYTFCTKCHKVLWEQPKE